jgi:aryl-alcohol dehydrogenase-like predicted oxidoreductase
VKEEFMKFTNLGTTGIRVSKICFGSLTTSELQKNFTAEKAADLFAYAIREHQINFFDTAELYGNYAHFRALLKRVKRQEFVLATKCYAYDRKTAQKSLEKALMEVGTDYLDLMMLHEQESEHTLRGHREAIEYFLEQKKKGVIRSIGYSTHFIKGVKAAETVPLMDVIFPLINRRGIGIADGERIEMEQAIHEQIDRGMGCYLMKPLGGGHLLEEYPRAISYLHKEFPETVIAIGMQSKTEVDLNVRSIVDRVWDRDEEERFHFQEKKLKIAEWCVGCGACVEACQQNALGLKDGKAVVLDQSKCVRCGYCAKACKEFCIKVV